MKKAKQGQILRKRLNFYKINYDFHYPYNLLVDGNFVYYCLQTNYPFSQKLQKYLKGPIFYYTTSCVLQELRSLGEQFFPTFLESKKFQTLNCKHEKCLNSDECIEQVVQRFKGKKFIVATQDYTLKEKLKQLEADVPVPVLFFAGQKLSIEKPSKGKIEADARENPNERKMIQKVQKEIKEEEFQKKKNEFEKMKNSLGLKSKKKAKGPNPLSMKKKIRKNVQKSTVQKSKVNVDNSEGKRKRTHKRSKKAKDEN